MTNDIIRSGDDVSNTIENRLNVLERRAGIVDAKLEAHMKMTQDTKEAVDTVKKNTEDLVNIFITARAGVRLFTIFGKIAQYGTVLMVFVIAMWMLAHSIRTNTTPYSMP